MSRARTFSPGVGRAAALELVAECRRLVAWHQKIAEDYRNAIQARLTGPRHSLSLLVRAEIDLLEHAAARAIVTADQHRARAQQMERLLVPRGARVGVLA